MTFYRQPGGGGSLTIHFLPIVSLHVSIGIYGSPTVFMRIGTTSHNVAISAY